MRVKLVCAAIIIVGLAAPRGARAEDVTFSTYFPYPAATYVTLRADRMSVGSAYTSPNPDPAGFADGDLRIASRLGIDTTTPTYPLTVRGSIAGRHPGSLRSTNNYGVVLGGIPTQTYGSIQAFQEASVVAVPLLINAIMRNTSNVRVGLGVAGDPQYQLEVRGSVGGRLDGVNTGALQLIWCPGGAPCAGAAGYYGYAVYD